MFLARQKGQQYTSAVCTECRRASKRKSALKYYYADPERAKAKRAARYAAHREHDAGVTKTRRAIVAMKNAATGVTAESKTCSKCKEIKVAQAFTRKPSSLDGLGSWCKPCMASNALRRYHDNREALNQKSLERYHANKEKCSTSNKLWMSNNRERRAAYAKAYQKKNKDRLRAAGAARHVRDKVRLNEQARQWKKKNPEKAIQHRHARRARIAGQGGRYTEQDIHRIKIAQRGRCAICRVPLHDEVCRDHIVPIRLGGTNEARNIQLTCKPCNSSKHAKDPITFMQERGFLL